MEWNKSFKISPKGVVDKSGDSTVYIIDNNSHDNSLEFVEKNFPQVKLISLDKNYGFAEGYNIGLKHVNELLKASKKNYKIYILFLVQRDDCKSLSIARDIDPDYAKALNKAVKKKLNILCYDCKFFSKGIKLNNKIKLKL